jgi:long-chain fatty acid transport protein
MTFSSPGLGPTPIDMVMPQNWDDQTVFQLGLAYKATDALTLRAGASFSDNPIPDSTMNFLFPAIEKDHYTAGFGYAFNKVSDVNFSLQYAPEVTQTNAPVTVDHSQLSWQFMYSHRF